MRTSQRLYLDAKQRAERETPTEVPDYLEVMRMADDCPQCERYVRHSDVSFDAWAQHWSAEHTS